jgi:DNA polymerase III subunit beta
MDITISKEELSRSISLTQNLTEKKGTMPILSNLLITAIGNTVQFAASDLETSTITKPVASIHREGSIAIIGRTFGEIVRELSDGDVRLTVTPDSRVEITSGSLRLRMNGSNGDGYPELPGMEMLVSGSVHAGTFLEMINKTLYATSTDEARFNLSGVYLHHPEDEEPGVVRAVGTDGHRLAIINRVLKGFEIKSGVIVPRRGLTEAKKLLSEFPESLVGLAIKEGFLIIDAGRTRTSIRLMDAEYPDYTRVVPKQPGVIATFSTDAISQALRRVALMVTDKGKCVKLDFATNHLSISSSSPELGEAKEELEIDYDGEPVSVGFNARYVVDIAASLGEEQAMALELHGNLGPGKFFAKSDDSYCGIVMPMRLS